MIRDNGLFPSPAPTSETENTRELLLIGFILSAAVVSFVFAMLLVDRYCIKKPKNTLMQDDDDSALEEEEEERLL